MTKKRYMAPNCTIYYMTDVALTIDRATMNRVFYCYSVAWVHTIVLLFLDLWGLS